MLESTRLALSTRRAFEERAVSVIEAGLANITGGAHVAQVELKVAAVGRGDVKLEVCDAARGVGGDEW